MRIVCFHQNQVGDLLFSLPALHNLRVGYPDAHITSVVRPNCAPLLELSQLADQVIARHPDPLSSELRILSMVRRERPDLAVLFSTSNCSALIALIARCRVITGFRRSPLSFLFTHETEWRHPASSPYNLKLLEKIGCPIEKRDYVGLIKTCDEERIEAERLLESAGIGASEQYAVIGAGTANGSEVKCWSDDRFAGVIDGIHRVLGLRSVVAGLNGGEAICGMSKYAVDLTGKTSTSVLAAVLEKARVFVGVDSGVMHLAAAMRVPVTALFGPSDSKITGPQGDGHRIVRAGTSCSPCLRRQCENRICMDGIRIDQVLQAVYECMNDTRIADKCCRH